MKFQLFDSENITTPAIEIEPAMIFQGVSAIRRGEDIYVRRIERDSFDGSLARFFKVEVMKIQPDSNAVVMD